MFVKYVFGAIEFSWASSLRWFESFFCQTSRKRIKIFASDFLYQCVNMTGCIITKRRSIRFWFSHHNLWLLKNMKNIVLWLSWNVSGKWLEDYEFEFENFNVYNFLREGTNSYRIQVKSRTDLKLLMPTWCIDLKKIKYQFSWW